MSSSIERKRPRRAAYALPTLFTSGNVFLGFAAVLQTFEGATEALGGNYGSNNHFSLAARLLGFAVFFDGLDGRIARMTNTVSDFGRELDSLADVITFGVAPAILAWVWGFRQLGTLHGPDMGNRVCHVGALTTFIFLVAGASRLARFNIQTNPKPWNPGRPGKKYFVGMPIPAGAGVIAATVHFMRGDPISTWWMSIVWGVLVFCTSLLMVSGWR